jgi:hypothetical protein
LAHLGCEPRSGGRSLAWGVSPRYGSREEPPALKGRQICTAWSSSHD